MDGLIKIELNSVKEGRFLLFAGADYYPTGGSGDYLASYETLEEAKKMGESLVGKFLGFEEEPLYEGEYCHQFSEDIDWFDVFDIETRTTAFKSKEQFLGDECPFVGVYQKEPTPKQATRTSRT